MPESPFVMRELRPYCPTCLSPAFLDDVQVTTDPQYCCPRHGNLNSVLWAYNPPKKEAPDA